MTNTPQENLKSFSRQLKAARERATLSQHDVAQQLAIKDGLSPLESKKIKNMLVAISGWENEKRIPEGQTVIRLQKMLNTVFVLD